MIQIYQIYRARQTRNHQTTKLNHLLTSFDAVKSRCIIIRKFNHFMCMTTNIKSLYVSLKYYKILTYTKPHDSLTTFNSHVTKGILRNPKYA